VSGVGVGGFGEWCGGGAGWVGWEESVAVGDGGVGGDALSRVERAENVEKTAQYVLKRMVRYH